MTPDAGLVAIVIVNWNGFDDTAACVESCRALDFPAFELIVVDNGSSDDSAEKLRSRFPHLTVIEAGDNLGFAGGNNLGIARGLQDGATYVWLLNNDTTVDAAALSALVGALDEHPDAGVAGSKVYFADKPDTLWFAGGCISPRWGWTYHRGEGEIDTGQFDDVDDVDYATGASLLIRASVIDQIGPMDADYFLYWEEVDWCERARNAGWRVLHVPASRVWHKVGAATPSDQAYVKSRYEGRNRVRFYRKNRPSRATGVAFKTLLNAGYLLLKGRPRSCFAMLAGVADAYRGRVGIIR